LKLVVICYVTIVHSDGESYFQDNLGRYIDGLASSFDEIVVVASSVKTNDNVFLINGKSIYQYSLKCSNVTLVEVPPVLQSKNGFLKKILNLLRKVKIFSFRIKNADLVYVFIPAYSGIIATLLCRLLSKPYCLYVGADWEEVLPYVYTLRRWIKTLYPLQSTLTGYLERQAVKGAIFTLVAGRKLLKKHSRSSESVYETLPVLKIEKGEFFIRKDTCLNSPVTCLYVGNLNPRKGIEYLIEGIGILKKQGHKLVLKLVGTGTVESLGRLRSIAQKCRVQHDVQFLGYIGERTRILEIYRECDIFVLPTLGEGFPRVLYESMSQGLPVVTTKISTILEGLEGKECAAFVSPHSAYELAEMIANVMTNGELRRKLIRNGYEFVGGKVHGDPAEQMYELTTRHLS